MASNASEKKQLEHAGKFKENVFVYNWLTWKETLLL